jgi:hypothetical protein
MHCPASHFLELVPRGKPNELSYDNPAPSNWFQLLVKLNILDHTCYENMYRFTDQSYEGRLHRKTCMFLVNKAISKLNTGNKPAICRCILLSVLSFHFDISIRQSALGLSQPLRLLHKDGKITKLMQQNTNVVLFLPPERQDTSAHFTTTNVWKNSAQNLVSGNPNKEQDFVKPTCFSQKPITFHLS